jgi:hypothetical protein
MLLRTHAPQSKRRGVILMVVLTMLTLFAIVGLSFVLYADSTATAADYNLRGETTLRPDIDPQAALGMILSQIIYDLPDDSTGVYSSLRAHSLARNMYGWYYPATPNSQTAPWQANCIPFSALGRMHTGTQPGEWPNMNTFAVDDYNLPNYQYNSADGFLRDPERYFPSGSATPYRTSPSGAVSPSYVGFNPSYTYPDLNAFYLAAVMADGTVLTPSYHREDLWGGALTVTTNANWTNTQGKYMTCRPRPNDHSGFPAPSDRYGDVKNLPWSKGGADSIWVDVDAPIMTSPDGRMYKMMVAPLIMDLDNRINANVVGNILANQAGSTVFSNASDQGWGIWEVNMSKLGTAANANEWSNVFLGSGAGTFTAQGTVPNPRQRILGRYGPNGAPANPVGPKAGVGAHAYAPADLDATWDVTNTTAGYTKGTVTGPNAFALPTAAGAGANANAPPYRSMPYYNPDAYFGGFPGELTTNHPVFYISQKPYRSTTNANNWNRAFPASTMFGLMYTGGLDSDGNLSDLQRLLPNNLASSARVAQMLTVVSADLDKPAMMPYVLVDPANGYNYLAMTTAAPATGTTPATTTQTYPQLGAKGFTVSMSSYRNPTTTLTTTEFDPATWRSVYAALGRIDINKTLTDPSNRYPNYQATGTTGFVNGAYNSNTGQMNLTLAQAQFYKAQKARADLAKQIFDALRKVTGAAPLPGIEDTNTPPVAVAPVAPTKANPAGSPGNAQFDALRWLAQLAVNIVDYLDDDDISTPFVWLPVDPNYTPAGGTAPDVNQDLRNFDPAQDPSGYGVQGRVVFGTELPRLVINETYVQCENTFGDNAGAATKPYNMNFWIELINPSINDSPSYANPPFLAGNAVLATGNDPKAQKSYPVYSVWLLPQAQTNLTKNNNVLGDPDSLTTFPNNQPPTVASDWAAAPVALTSAKTVVQPVDNSFGTGAVTSTANPNPGFFVLAPPPNIHNAAENPNLNALANRASANMTYTLPFPAGAAATTPVLTPVRPTILLRRLACPALPPNPALPTAANPNPAISTTTPYNPYITVDYVANVPYFDAREFNGANAQTANWAGSAYSYGRMQPHDATRYSTSPAALFATAQTANPKIALTQADFQQTGRVPQYRYNNGNAATTPAANAPAHSFQQHNFQTNTPPTAIYTQATDTLYTPFTWLTHLDRQVTSPIELLQVSAFPPHRLTHRFTTAAGGATPTFTPYAHVARWTENNLPIYRLLEIIEAGPRASGVMSNGRVPGKININTIWDREVFRALADAQPGNSFYGTAATPDQNVDAVFATMIARRTPGLTLATPVVRSVKVGTTVADRPFWGLGIGFNGTNTATNAGYTDALTDSSSNNTNRGISRTDDQLTLLSPAVAGGAWNTQRLLEPTVPGATTGHPYQRYELLAKIFNNVTTRSNTFAVFLTIGFFEVDQTSLGQRPVKLKAEIGLSENRNVRHRMFAIVDRTALYVFQQAVTFTDSKGNAVSPTAGTAIYWPVQTGTTPQALQDTRTNRWWQPIAGSTLILDQGTNIEEVVTLKTDPATGLLMGTVQNTHNSSVNVKLLGNPGPMTNFDPRNDPALVPFFAIID